MDRIPVFGNIPPISRAWLAAMFVLAAVTTNNIVPLAKLVFIPKKIAAEPWRLVLLFCYFGGLSLILLQHALLISRTTSQLENAFTLDLSCVPLRYVARLPPALRARLRAAMAENRTADYAYFLALVAASIVGLVYVTIWLDSFNVALVYLGPVLEAVLMYVYCRNSPEADMVILGFLCKAKYCPFIMLALKFLLSDDYTEFVASVRHDGVVRSLSWLLHSSFAVETVFVYLAGHTWWFVRFFCMENLYNEHRTDTRAAWADAYAAVAVDDAPWWLNVARVVTLPVWYHWTIWQLLREGEAPRDGRRKVRRDVAAALRHALQRLGTAQHEDASQNDASEHEDASQHEHDAETRAYELREAQETQTQATQQAQVTQDAQETQETQVSLELQGSRELLATAETQTAETQAIDVTRDDHGIDMIAEQDPQPRL